MQKGNGVKGKYMENMDYTIKNIDKLEDLNGFEWEYQGKEFFFRIYTLDDEYTLALAIKKFKDYKTGEKEKKNLIHFSLRNLTELEFYGLKVVLNEKPKLTAEDHKFLQKLNPENGINKFYITRDLNGTLVMNFDKPQKNTDYQEWHSDKDHILVLSEELFPFITWESGKAWSKSELMKLKVID